MMIAKNIFLFQLIAVLTFSPMYAQIAKSPTSALSPNVASLGVYGDIPVSYYTGIPDINIPLYDLTEKDFKLPISLSYHTATGIMPDQRAGWTGLGWSLHAGGMISRKMNDLPDEYNNPDFVDGKNIGYYFTHDILNTPIWSSTQYLSSIARNFNNYIKDTHPDEFSFNFSTYSGKFYLNHNGEWQVKCDKPVKVDFLGDFLDIPFKVPKNPRRYSPCFSGFRITTEDGIQYIFGSNINSIEFSLDFFNQTGDNMYATSWHLTKIILPSKQEIDLTYERGDFINQMYISVQHDLGSKTKDYNGIFVPSADCYSFSFTPVEHSYRGSLIFPIYLKEILTSSMCISFSRSVSNELKYTNDIYQYHYDRIYEANQVDDFLPYLKTYGKNYPAHLDNLKWHKLDTITIQDKPKTQIIKTFTFNYNNKPSERLALKSLTESGKGSYVFHYNNLDKMPRYLSNMTDHWGFFNNTYAKLDYVDDPKYYETYYESREPNVDVMGYGVLNKIIYPTGGYTEFIFEPHTYNIQLNSPRWKGLIYLNSNKIAGGLRIKQIKKSSSIDIPAKEVKEYFYISESDFIKNKESSQISSGVLGGQIQYAYLNYKVTPYDGDKTVRYISLFSSVSVLPSCHNAMGSHIGYTFIIEKNSDNSLTTYSFSNFETGNTDEAPIAYLQESRTAYEPYTSRAENRGKLNFVGYYNKSGQLIKKKNIFYSESSNNYVRAMNAVSYRICPDYPHGYEEGTAYKIYTYTMLPVYESEIYYDPLTGRELQVAYKNINYNQYNLPRRIIFNDSKNQSFENIYYYYSDLMKMKSDREATINAKRKEYEPLYLNEKSECETNCAESPPLQGTGQLSVYQCQQRCLSVFNSQVNADLQKWDPNYLKYAPYIDLIEDVKASNMMALPINISKRVLKEGKYYVLNSNIFLYKKDEYGNIVHYETLNFESDNILDDKSGLFLDVYGYDQRFKTRENYTYNKFKNLTTLTNTNGISVCYLWSYNGQYPIAEIKSASYNEVIQKLGLPLIDKLNSSLMPEETDLKKVNELRTLLPYAQISTYTYQPLVGMLTSTDPQGITTYYNYDLFGRLKETYLMENGVKKVLQSYDYKYKNQ